jgi:hypothetical protein
VLSVRDQDDLESITRKMLKRMDEIDALTSALREERDQITSALLAVAYKPAQSYRSIYTRKETEYALRKPFRQMSLTDACLKVLKDHSDEWLDKNQVEYMVARGGYEFKAEHATNSVHVTLRRLVHEGFCEAYSGKGSRTTKHRFVKDREPTTVTPRSSHVSDEPPKALSPRL